MKCQCVVLLTLITGLLKTLQLIYWNGRTGLRVREGRKKPSPGSATEPESHLIGYTSNIFTWYRASRGISATAELLIFQTKLFSSVGRISEWRGLRSRRQRRRGVWVWGGDVALPTVEGDWRGGCAPPQKIFAFLHQNHTSSCDALRHPFEVILLLVENEQQCTKCYRQPNIAHGSCRSRRILASTSYVNNQHTWVIFTRATIDSRPRANGWFCANRAS